ncbi:NUDIX hydrolase [Fusibacter tunisiensis]|uniref:8-oxo-dGTP pyrophosphatase MutT (NUDIX family) n=1 Tax=Fusibacter tunisiensis TaxID=1008308 RepID=A0ABS2MTC1_9FIRM|nr:NUDIX hydrolase [Fusibacter tunisiensis]MBM7562654.1 8-oxo-dGTP pyrophosphatase MutT (NUDIX family) [Fusibacter tunisiensis]
MKLTLDTILKNYHPKNEVEREDLKVLIKHYEQVGNSILYRNRTLAHLTSSAVVLNHNLTHMLMVHHNIYNTWTWVGGHNDGDFNCLGVALKETLEETGLSQVKPLTEEAQSIEVLTVDGHYKKGQYVTGHLHLNVSFVFIADDSEMIRPNLDENSKVQWIPINEISVYSNEPDFIKLYLKLIDRARNYREATDDRD